MTGTIKQFAAYAMAVAAGCCTAGDAECAHGAASEAKLWAKIGAFQETDANSGVTAAISEMLVQSHETDEYGTVVVELLPALPEAWKREGSFKGLRLRGGWVADCEWRDGKVTEYSIRPVAEKPAKWKLCSKISNNQKGE